MGRLRPGMGDDFNWILWKQEAVKHVRTSKHIPDSCRSEAERVIELQVRAITQTIGAFELIARREGYRRPLEPDEAGEGTTNE